MIIVCYINLSVMIFMLEQITVALQYIKTNSTHMDEEQILNLSQILMGLSYLIKSEN